MKPKSIYNIQVFINFANFYLHFIQGFSKIAALFTSILKTTKLPNIQTHNNVASGNRLNKIGKFTKPSFLTSKAKLAFTQLKQALSKASILYYFDLVCYI